MTNEERAKIVRDSILDRFEPMVGQHGTSDLGGKRLWEVMDDAITAALDAAEDRGSEAAFLAVIEGRAPTVTANDRADERRKVGEELLMHGTVNLYGQFVITGKTLDRICGMEVEGEDD